jgi:Wax ester synthase-like Acyl-CoA acyltransferase domain/Transposase IS116/IS110/IS902 family
VKRLCGADAFFLFTERPAWPMHIGALATVDASEVPGWGFESFRRSLAERLPLVPEFAMKLKEVPFSLDRPLLVRDPDFTLDYHLHRIAVPAPGGPRELCDLVGGLAEVQLDRRRPLWDAWFIEGLEHGRFALFMKTHHALVDGVSGAGLSEILADLEPNPAPRPPASLPPPERVPGDVELLARGAVSALTSPGRTVRWAADFARRTPRDVRTIRRLGGRTALDRAPRVPFNGTLGPRRRFAFTSVPLEDVKRVKNAHGVKLNDVVLALASGAVRRWLLARDALPDEPVVASVPMSLRAKGDMERAPRSSPCTRPWRRTSPTRSSGSTPSPPGCARPRRSATPSRRRTSAGSARRSSRASRTSPGASTSRRTWNRCGGRRRTSSYGTAPLPVWSANRQRHRLSRTGNRQLNAAIHRIAITQARCHPDAINYLERRKTMNNTPTEARRALKRRLSDIVYRALLADAQATPPACLGEAA